MILLFPWLTHGEPEDDTARGTRQGLPVQAIDPEPLAQPVEVGLQEDHGDEIRAAFAELGLETNSAVRDAMRPAAATDVVP